MKLEFGDTNIDKLTLKLRITLGWKKICLPKKNEDLKQN